MKIRFYTNNKEAIVFDLEDILKQLNIEEQVATVGLVIEKDEAEVEAIAQTIQDDYPNMYLQAKEYGRNLTLACAELPNPTNPDIVTYLYAGDDATETDSWIAKVNNTIRAQGDNSERLIHMERERFSTFEGAERAIWKKVGADVSDENSATETRLDAIRKLDKFHLAVFLNDVHSGAKDFPSNNMSWCDWLNKPDDGHLLDVKTAR